MSAWFIPRSINSFAICEGIKAIETTPYDAAVKSLATIITPKADMIVATRSPISNIIPPLALLPSMLRVLLSSLIRPEILIYLLIS